MKKAIQFTILLSLFFISLGMSIVNAESYVPTAQNLNARDAFRADKFGLFVHWGPFSIPGDGEWVMNNQNINFENYSRLKDFFNPTEFNAEQWVSMAKKAGMKYITFVARHHDGFSMWDTKFSDYNIMNTPYKQDILKLLADECQKQGIKLVVYYSLVDWSRSDYPFETGNTGRELGRTGKGDYASYFQFMKNQLTELLTNYGSIAGIWFDGHWDQTAPEGSADRSARIDWRYDELYAHIHRLQPQTLIGNNHHLEPLPGEDFQMFEKDLPGENKYGLSFQQASKDLPLETCETMNNSWGFNLSDNKYKSSKELINYLVNAAGRDTNLLLNVGPMPNGKIQPEFVSALAQIGDWMNENGETIYGTRGNIIPPQNWGTVTQKGNKLYVHILQQKNSADSIFIPVQNIKIVSATERKSGDSIKFKQLPEGIFIYTTKTQPGHADSIIELNIR